jgi:single-strand DNA-binding protein
MTEIDGAHAADNEVFLRGRLAAEPEPRTLPSGDEIVTFRLTVPRSGTAPSRAKVDSIDCAAGLARVRRCLDRAEPGDQLEVTGSLHRRFWRTGAGLGSRYEVQVSTARRISRAPARQAARRRQSDA